MQTVCYLGQKRILQCAGLETNWGLPEKTPGQNPQWIKKRIRLTAISREMRQLVLKMETSGPFRKQMLVLLLVGSGEQKRIHQRQWTN